MRKILTSIILASMITSLIACSSDGGNSVETTAENAVTSNAAAETEPQDSLSACKAISDGVPDLDLGGEDYRIFYQQRYTTDAIPPDGEENGDIINDAIYKRNRTVEERFNVKVVGIEGAEEEMVNTLIASVTSGEDAYDLFMGHSIYSGTAALGGCFRNWYDIPYIDFTKPWFPQEAIEELTINDRMYMTMGDMALSFIRNVYCMFFNKEMAEANGIEDIYALVNSGEWTLEKLDKLSSTMYSDLNGSGTADLDDRYGFAGFHKNHPTTWLFACDIDTVEFHDDITVTSVFLRLYRIIHIFSS